MHCIYEAIYVLHAKLCRKKNMLCYVMLYVCVHVCEYMCICMCKWVHAYRCTYAFMYMCAWARICVCIWTRMFRSLSLSACDESPCFNFAEDYLQKGGADSIFNYHYCQSIVLIKPRLYYKSSCLCFGLRKIVSSINISPVYSGYLCR